MFPPPTSFVLISHSTLLSLGKCVQFSAELSASLGVERPVTSLLVEDSLSI